jgi:hypothetical protein
MVVMLAPASLQADHYAAGDTVTWMQSVHCRYHDLMIALMNCETANLDLERARGCTAVPRPLLPPSSPAAGGRVGPLPCSGFVVDTVSPPDLGVAMVGCLTPLPVLTANGQLATLHDCPRLPPRLFLPRHSCGISSRDIGVGP